jgi:heme-degrading monooxygenase HmoA
MRAYDAPVGSLAKGGKGMYAAVGVWNMEAGSWEEQQRGLHEEIVPMVRQIPGFVSGYWMGDRSTAKTYTTIVWEDEEAAQRFKGFVLGDERQEAREGGGVINESFVIAEVHAEARP